MKKCILLLCLLFACMATTFAQTDTIRFTTCSSYPSLTGLNGQKDTLIIYATPNTSIEIIQGDTTSIYSHSFSSDVLKIAVWEIFNKSTSYKLYATKGKIFSFAYAKGTYGPFVSLDVSDCVNLDSLDCSNSWTSRHNYGLLKNLIVKGCTNLKKLDCREQGLTTLDVSGCTSLKKLDCSYQENLSRLDVSSCTALEELDCSAAENSFASWMDGSCNPVKYGKLAHLNVNGCTNLVKLVCDNQLITHLDVNGLSNLSHLSCRGGWCSGTSRYGHTYYFSTGCLINLEVSGCERLQHLDCQNNPLDSLNIRGLSNLQTLYVPDGYGGSEYSLIKLDAGNCKKLIFLNILTPERTLALKYLDLKNCEQVLNLNALSLSKNFPYLEYLDVSNCTKLKNLYVADCGLTFLGVSGCTNLQELSCSKNKLKNLDLSGCDSLRSLFCYGNQLSTLNASGCSALTKMEAQNNALPLSECYTLPQCNDRKLTPQNIYVNCTVDRGLDLSGEMSFNGYATTCSVKLNNAVATAGQDYTINDSMVSFLTGGSFEIMLRNTAVKGAEVYYHVTVPYKVKTPRIKSSQDTLAPGSKVSIICATEDVRIYYTLDGTDPSETSLRYYYPIKLNESTTIKAIAVKYGWTNSDIATASFIVKDPNDDNNDPLAITPLQPQIALNAYPNPCGDILYIETSQNNKDGEIHAFRILDLQGREQICALGSVRQIDMSRMPVGVYLLEAIGKNGAVCRHKIIKR